MLLVLVARFHLVSSPHANLSPECPYPVRKNAYFAAQTLTSENRSKEHVLPDWLLRHFQIGDYVISPEARSGEAIVRRRHSLGSFLLGSVCNGCNGGWMSESQKRTR